MSENHNCPSCGAEGMEPFYRVDNVPVNSVLLLSTRDEALNFPTGTIQLGFCQSCGFIANTAFKSELTEYSSRYEATQAYSPTFNAFAHRQATGLIEKYDLNEKTIVEIGCGMGVLFSFFSAPGLQAATKNKRRTIVNVLMIELVILFWSILELHHLHTP